MLSTFSFLAGKFKHLRYSCLLNVALMGIQQASYVLTYLLIAGLLASDSGKFGTWPLWAVALAGLALVYYFCNLRYNLAAFTGAYSISANLRLRICAHMRKLSMAFFKTRNTGELCSALIEDIKSMETVYGMYLFDLVACLVFPLLLLLLTFFFSWQIAGVMLLSLLVALPLMFLACRVTAGQGPEYLRARDKAFTSLIEYLGGIRELKAANQTGLRFIPLLKAWKVYQQRSMKMEAQYGLLALAYNAVLDAGFLVTVLVGVTLTQSGSATLAAFIFFLIAGCRFVEPMQQLGTTLPELRYGAEAAGRLSEILQTSPLPELPPEKRDGHAVAFENVSFAYSAGDMVINDVALSIPEREVVALVGPSGGGKTTLANLLLRFWDPTGGRITIGGADIRSLPREEFYSLFSMVFQDVFLFDDTVFNNIKLARPEASEVEILEAARLARCEEFIGRLEQGYETMVGERGERLSGGEKQRISIARAILKNAPIVIMDEATAFLDPENELSVQQGLNSLLLGKSLLIIAHRLETIRSADSIIVLDQGRIAEQGTHDQLLAAEGIYARLWAHQNTIKSWQLKPSSPPNNETEGAIDGFRPLPQ
jgi:ATP-binding cassette subfamily B protein